MLKQRNLFVRPENTAAADAEIAKLQHFGWTLVEENEYEDGSKLVSFIRDDEEMAEEVANEARYRSAKLAAEFAKKSNERLLVLKSGKKKSNKAVKIIPIVICALLAIACFIGGLVPYLVDGVTVKIFDYPDAKKPRESFKFGGDWEYRGYNEFPRVIKNAEGKSVLNVMPQFKELGFIICASAGIMFLAVAVFLFARMMRKDLNSLDYAMFALDEATYYSKLQKEASADAKMLYPNEPDEVVEEPQPTAEEEAADAEVADAPVEEAVDTPAEEAAEEIVDTPAEDNGAGDAAENTSGEATEAPAE